ncbi:MAG: Integral rane transporter, partial [Modestobacter sp.]|nr:Integral rane transporter [Modestobacter sp.]
GAPAQATGPTPPPPPPPVPPQSIPPESPWAEPVPASARPPAPSGPPHSTGPVDIVPGFSAPATPPVPPPAGSTAVTGDDGTPGPGTRARSAGKAFGTRLGTGLRSGRGLDRSVLTGLALGIAALALLEWGLALEPGDRSLWSAVPSWSAFATVAAVAALVPLVLGLLPPRLPARTAWQIGAAGAAGLAAFWVLIALPLVASDRGFLLTAALALAAGAVWLAPGRTE